MSAPNREQMEALWADERVRAARLAGELRHDLASNPTAKAIVEESNRMRESALERLANAKPWDTDEIFAAQFDFNVAKGMIVAIQRALERGDIAAQDIELAECVD